VIGWALPQWTALEWGVPGLAGRVIEFCRSSPCQTRGRGRPRPAHRVHGTGPTRGWCAVASRRMAPRGSSCTVFREGLVSWARGHSPHQPRWTTTRAAAVVPRPPNLFNPAPASMACSGLMGCSVPIFYLTRDGPTKAAGKLEGPATSQAIYRRSSNEIVGLGLTADPNPPRVRMTGLSGDDLARRRRDLSPAVRLWERTRALQRLPLRERAPDLCCSP
jgi:hypothetical protein